MLQSGAGWGGVGHRYGHMNETRPSPIDRESLLKEVAFDMDPKADRNSPEDGEGHSRQSCCVFHRKAGWRVESITLCCGKAGRVGRGLI